MDRPALEKLIWRATIICLGLDPDDKRPEVQGRVRKSWPGADTGNPNWQRDEDVVFLRITPSADPYGNIYDEDYYGSDSEGGTETVGYHRSWQISWVCYGPGSDRDASMIRVGILRDAVRSYLLRHNVAIQPGIPEPIRIPEPDETGEWWERCDLSAEAYEYVRETFLAEIVTEPPEIHLRTTNA